MLCFSVCTGVDCSWMSAGEHNTRRGEYKLKSIVQLFWQTCDPYASKNIANEMAPEDD